MNGRPRRRRGRADPGVTVAVSVSDWPKTIEPSDAVATVLDALMTVAVCCVEAVLVVKLVSPW